MNKMQQREVISSIILEEVHGAEFYNQKQFEELFIK